jgi:hypothetical protein
MINWNGLDDPGDLVIRIQQESTERLLIRAHHLFGIAVLSGHSSGRYPIANKCLCR